MQLWPIVLELLKDCHIHDECAENEYLTGEYTCADLCKSLSKCPTFGLVIKDKRTCVAMNHQRRCIRPSDYEPFEKIQTITMWQGGEIKDLQTRTIFNLLSSILSRFYLKISNQTARFIEGNKNPL